MIKITAMTTMCADIFEDTGEILPGGEALNLAAAACRYPHMDVGIIGAIGDDEVGRHVLQAIEQRPIRRSGVHIIPGGRTASHIISLTPEGDRYFKPNAWQGGVFDTFQLSEDDVREIHASDVVFITWSSPNFRDVLALRREGSFKLAVDFDVLRDFRGFLDVLPHVDFFFISGTQAMEPLYHRWSTEYNGLFNVTLAEKGSVTFHRGERFSVQAVPVKQVVDTTGCGDSYHAGFLCSYMKDGDILAAMHEGSRVASETLSHTGGF